jgi:hypothetical protein
LADQAPAAINAIEAPSTIPATTIIAQVVALKSLRRGAGGPSVIGFPK